MNTESAPDPRRGSSAPGFRAARALALFAGLLLPPTWAAEPATALPRLVSRQGHAGQVETAVLSDDSRVALTTASDKQAILWDLATGRPVRHFLARAGIAAAALSPDNSRAVTADGPDILVWDTRTGDQVARLAHHTKPLSGLSVSADGKHLLATSADGTASLWALPAGPKPAPVRVFPGPDLPRLSAATLDQEGRRVLTYHSVIRSRLSGGVLVPENTAVLWDAASGAKLYEWKGDKKPLISAHLAPDGAAVVTTHAFGRVTVWDTKGTKVDEFDPPGKQTLAASVGFSADARRVLVAWGDDVHCVRDTAAGRTLWSFRPAAVPNSLTKSALAPDGKTVVVWNEPALEFYDVDAAQLLSQLQVGFQMRARALTVSRDSKAVLAGFADGNAAVLDVRSGKLRTPLASATDLFKALAVTPTGVRAVTQPRDGGLDATLPAFLEWPLEGRVTKQNLVGEVLVPPLRVTRFALIDPTGRRLITAGLEHEFILWELPACKPQRLAASSRKDGWVTAVAFGPDGAIAAGSDAEAVIYPLGRRPAVRLAPIAGTVGLIAFTTDGKHVFTRSDSGTGDRPNIEEALWEVDTGRRVARTPARSGRPRNIVPAPAPPAPQAEPTDRNPVWDEAGTGELVVARRDGHTRPLPDGRRPDDILRDPQNGQVLSLCPCWAAASEWAAPAVSPQGDLMATVQDRVVTLWNPVKKAYLRRCDPSPGAITALAFRPDGKAVIGACRDALRAWDTSTGRELAVFTVMDRQATWVEAEAKGVVNVGIDPGRRRANNWLVATRGGQFDTGSIDEGGPYSWVFGDHPFRPLPPEMFVRDYYEPRLLARVLGGEALPPARPPAELNRAQPRVAVPSIIDGVRFGTVDVTVTVDPADGQVLRDGRILRTNSVHDLRLFRDGQLVAQEPPPADPDDPKAADWGDSTRLRPGPRVVEDEKTGRMTVTFRAVSLPSNPGESVAFNAYAFNADRVKSGTSRPRTFAVPPAVPRKKGRAYVICVGVGQKDAADGLVERFPWLHFTPHGAKRVRDELRTALEAGGEYEQVIPVLLASHDLWEGKTAIRPTKENIRAVLRRLAGTDGEDDRAGIPPALREAMWKDVGRATPDDLVVIYYSGHGYSPRGGDFYLIPANSGENPGTEVRPEVLRQAISGRQLSDWLRGIDAGEMVLVIDACNSGAVSPVKPAPLGDRGLGQLAYDKAASVLAAVQAAGEARSEGGIDYSLLAYTLAVEGLAEKKGTPGGRVRMNELLEFAAGRAPAVWKEKVALEFNQGQLPVLLDYSHRKSKADGN